MNTPKHPIKDTGGISDTLKTTGKVLVIVGTIFEAFAKIMDILGGSRK